MKKDSMGRETLAYIQTLSYQVVAHRQVLYRAAILSALLALIVLSGCSGSDNPSSPPTSISSETSATPSASPTSTPVKIALMFDKTGSINYTRTPQISPGQIAPLINLIQERGGEIGAGLISDNSNKSLLRLLIKEPPVEPILKVIEPQLGDTDTIELAKQQRENDNERARYDKAHDRFVSEKRAWENETNQQIERFNAELKDLLEVKPSFMATDVWGAITRSELFLSEDDSNWSQPTHRYLILISDGQHNVSSKSAVMLKSGAKLLLVNGSASVGALESLRPMPFESAQAAFQHVIATEGGKR